MLDFGYDEGGGNGTLLVSAQIGTTKRLRRFTRNWNTALRKSGVKFFHSKDYGNITSGVFVKLDDRARTRLLGKCAGLIHDFVNVGITARIDLSIYKAETTPAFRNKWGTAFCFGVETVILAGSLYMEEKGRETEPVNILIEQGHANAGQAIDHITDAMQGSSIVKIRSCGKASKEDHPLLQAADMLAYSEWQQMTAGGEVLFSALNVEGTPYATHIFDCTPELIRVVKQGVDRRDALCKAFGLRVHAAHAPRSQ